MARQVIKLDIAKDTPPLLSTNLGQTAYIAGLGSSVTSPGKNPQTLFVENCLPTTFGWQSFGLTAIITPAGVSGFDEIYRVQDPLGNMGLICPTAGRMNMWRQGDALWYPQFTVPAQFPNPPRTTCGTYGNQSFMCINDLTANALNGIYSVLVGSGAGSRGLVAALRNNVALGGLPAFPAILGITTSSNYMIAWSATTIYWSNPTNPIDFVPSLITGAGNAVPTDLQGTIIVCYPITNGFLICTTEGILSAQYSGGSIPWIFKSVGGGGAIIGEESISHDMIDANQVAWTGGGLVSLDANQATLLDAEITDFLRAKKLESFNWTTGLPVQTVHAGDKAIKVVRVSERYLIISFGIPPVGAAAQVYTHALIYDTVLKRVGKLVATHTELFAWPFSFSGSSVKIAMLLDNGSMYLLDVSAVAAHLGVCIFGRLALTRNSNCTIQHVVAEGSSNCNVIPLNDGVTPVYAVPMVAISPNHYGSRITAQTHLLSTTGQFNLTFLEATVHQAGSR